jgi:hypothetical protein
MIVKAASLGGALLLTERLENGMGTIIHPVGTAYQGNAEGNPTLMAEYQGLEQKANVSGVLPANLLRSFIKLALDGERQRVLA